MLEHLNTVPFPFFCKLCIVISFWCVGIYKNSDPEEFFHWLFRLSQPWPWYIKKPLIHCVDCMASLHGLYITAAIFFLKGISATLFLQTWIPAVLVCSVLNGIVYLVWGIMNEYYKKIFLSNGYNNNGDSGAHS